jgi:hypothetical protein
MRALPHFGAQLDGSAIRYLLTDQKIQAKYNSSFATFI